MKVGYKTLIEEAEKNIETMSVDEVARLLHDETVTIVDIRDIRELQREGKLPGAIHAPRGMLEFWVDPDSPYHRELFSKEKKFVFYCASAWRSALATQTVQQMGMNNVCHMSGGFTAWKEAEQPIEPVEKKA
ncbi:MAG: rhodanese-like domain-containing protein [Gammaproteobacteria bacterium]|jgi:rhodanese-related sulfurtransferase|nr:rhodanese-like domain-containing protein [Gammaproteobacteria bacterium]MBT3869187.1 rhodanese-like domain-containing protein [Gammaproteobacteria bacterium]MBT4377620.1 rhodanese-like domain-containing protein [Gammaproteobacteria bacterium]MBT4615763.1 rhodanese-like domain-containing protein [Gammaproteobacteria bacterium]MBT5196144.1 rhodanese-like domain-containing protein [Gammaproteobacteria bacterium]